ncbi:MAG: right-handed parallel beta-helix repeat-containing protein [Deltaproteobacteria bacterium]|nr:right-handed parallel beta-helix repeat-containing protein [Deltaproteobacteria bacterium]
MSAPACGGDGAASEAPPSTPTGPDGCQEGFARDASLGACVEILPAAECAPGAMPLLGKTECVPVGWSGACPSGFVRDASGFACVDRIPVGTKCTGATREDVTTGGCVPIGDCNAAFPPPGATLFVDDDGPEDATHFRTLKAAMNVAKPGTIVAVEAGTYKEVIELTAPGGVTVAGRCAEKVRFESPGGIRAGIFGNDTGTIRGVTVSGFRGGILLEGGAMTVEDVVLDGNDTLGAFLRFGAKVTVRRSKITNTVPGTELGSALVIYDGSVLTLEDTALTDNYFRHATVDGAGSTLDARRTVFARNTKLTGSDEESAVYVEDGALAKLVESIVIDSLHEGARVTGEGSTLELERSVVRRTSGRLKAGGGLGLSVFDKGRVRLVDSAVTDMPVLGLYAGKGGGVVAMERSTIVGLPPSATNVEFGRGASASEGGRLELKDVAVVGCPQSGLGLQMKASGTFDRVLVKDARPIKETLSTGPSDYGGFGLVVEKESTATITNSAFLGNTTSGISSNFGSEVTAEAVLVRGTREIPGLLPGSATQVATSGKMTFTRSALVGNTSETAMATTSGVLSIAKSTVHGTRKDVVGAFGHGLAVFQGASIFLDDVAVFDHPAVGLVSDGGQAFVNGGLFARNGIAVHAQNGASVTQVDGNEGLGGGELRVSSSTRFVENGARVGNGVVALPNAPLE